LLTSTAPPKLKKQRFWGSSAACYRQQATQQRYIRIDEECWRRHLWARLCDLGLEDCDQGDMMSMFVEGGTYRTDISRSREGLPPRNHLHQRYGSHHQPNARKDRSSLSPIDYVPARDRVIGVDPGRVNIMTCCVTMERDAVPRRTSGRPRAVCSHDPHAPSTTRRAASTPWRSR
jgi:hypothetical protein